MIIYSKSDSGTIIHSYVARKVKSSSPQGYDLIVTGGKNNTVQKQEIEKNPIQKQEGNLGASDSVVYFLIMTHGNMKFDLNTKKPDYAVIPTEMKRFSKVTFGVFSIPIGLNDKDKENIHKKIIEKIPNNVVDGKPLSDLLRTEFQDEHFVIYDDAFKNADKPSVTAIKNQPYFDKMFQSFVYTPESTLPIIEKEYTTGSNDSEWFDVFVAFEKGGNFKVGQRVVNKTHTNKQDTSPNGYTNTTELLKLAVQNGYKQVVMIDFSCDPCGPGLTNPEDEAKYKVSDEDIQQMSQLISEGKLGRG